MDRYCKRLIEVDLPIKRISAHSRREKSIRHGHISTLHIWWARRPLAACRAVICASLWPDPADELCPDKFRKIARELMRKWAKDHLNLISEDSWPRFVAISKDERKLDDPIDLRTALLDFIADFANWDNSTIPEFLETSRLLTQAAHEALGGESGSRPLVVDPFAGGGAIPLEALRVGADAFASDLLDVPTFINRIMLEELPSLTEKILSNYIRLAEVLRKRVSSRLKPFFPINEKHGEPFVYFWARTIQCEGPKCGRIIPLVGNPHLCTRKDVKASIVVEYPSNSKEPSISFARSNDKRIRKITSGGAATCICGYTTPVKSVRSQLKKRRGGTDDALLLAVGEFTTNRSKRYRLPNESDYIGIKKGKELRKQLQDKDINDSASVFPDEKLFGKARMNIGLYGMDIWQDIFTSRQLVQLRIYQEELAKITSENINQKITFLLAITLNKLVDYGTSLCRWVPRGEFVAATIGGEKKLPMMWDYAEVVLPGTGPGSWKSMVDWVTRFLRHIISSGIESGQVSQGDARIPLLPNDTVQGLITDPPYYDAIWYGDLSDMFAVWLRRTMALINRPIGTAVKGQKEGELIKSSFSARDGFEDKNDQFYEKGLEDAFAAWRKTLVKNGIAVIVFAHKSTAGWEAILKALINAGWVVTASWPIDTERQARMTALGQAALQSSVHLICRPKDEANELVAESIGDWRDVLSELPKRIHEWMPRLAEEGVVGADAIFACLGPALEIYSRYSSVEKASGEKVELKEYLEEVWAAVSREALNMIFEGADASGFEEDARLTAIWLWTLRTAINGNNDATDDSEPTKKIAGYSLEYDAARKIAQGLGAHLETLAHLVEIKGKTATLLPVAARTRYLFGKDAAEAPKGKRKKKARQQTLFDFEEDIKQIEKEPGDWAGELSGKAGSTVLDQLNQSMILFAAGRGEAMKRFLVEEGVGRNPLFWRLAQALSALYPAGTDEKRWVDGVLGRKKGLGL